METTMQPSLPAFRSKITVIETIELTVLGLLLWFLFSIDSKTTLSASFLDQLAFLAVFEGMVLGSWVLYNTYIRIARAVGKRAGTRLWITTVVLTGSYTFWSWIILDINRFIMSKLFYRGEAPVEYAWSWKSREVRKAWEQARKAGKA